MGKGRRVRAERRVLGASVEADAESRAGKGTPVAEPRSAADRLAARVADGPAVWSALDRRNDGLVRLEELVAMRDEARVRCREARGGGRRRRRPPAGRRGQLGADRAGAGRHSAGCPAALRRAERFPQDRSSPASSTAAGPLSHMFSLRRAHLVSGSEERRW